MGENVFLYRSIRKDRDHIDGVNRYIRRSELAAMSYGQLLERLLELRREESYGRAA